MLGEGKNRAVESRGMSFRERKRVLFGTKTILLFASVYQLGLHSQREYGPGLVVSFSCQSPDRDTKGPHVSAAETVCQAISSCYDDITSVFYVYYRRGSGWGLTQQSLRVSAPKLIFSFFNPTLPPSQGEFLHKNTLQIFLAGWAGGK